MYVRRNNLIINDLYFDEFVKTEGWQRGRLRWIANPLDSATGFVGSIPTLSASYFFGKRMRSSMVELRIVYPTVARSSRVVSAFFDWMCSSMVEQSAVNRKAVGSTPAASAIFFYIASVVQR